MRPPPCAGIADTRPICSSNSRPADTFNGACRTTLGAPPFAVGTAEPGAGGTVLAGVARLCRSKGAAPTAASVPLGNSSNCNCGRERLRMTCGVTKSTISVLVLLSRWSPKSLPRTGRSPSPGDLVDRFALFFADQAAQDLGLAI